MCKIPDIHTDDIKTQGSSNYNYDPPCNKFVEDNEFYVDVKNEEMTNYIDFDILKEQKEDTNDIKESYSEAQPTEYLAKKLKMKNLWKTKRILQTITAEGRKKRN